MRRHNHLPWFAACLAAIGLAGCQSHPPAGTDVQSGIAKLPRITALYEKATQTHVHRFRKPYRDEQARLLAQLQKECEVMLADVRTWDSSATLTAAGETERQAFRSDVDALRTSLEQLRTAAGKADTASMRSAHAASVSAYARVQKELGTAAP